MINPELGNTIRTGAFDTNYHDAGCGDNVLLIHGSGPGVTAWANWQHTLPILSRQFRVIAPDMAGFGYTQRIDDYEYTLSNWVKQVIDLMDVLDIEKAHLVGNSYGGALALASVIAHPERFNRVALMGSVGVWFELTPGLDAVWGYKPSVENMQSLLRVFIHNEAFATAELADMRYRASIRPGFQETFAKLFPAPRQRWIDALASNEADIKNIAHETLIIHGREDKVIPMATSQKLFSLIPNAQLHICGHCGHWTQIEQKERFNQLLINFFNEEQDKLL